MVWQIKFKILFTRAKFVRCIYFGISRSTQDIEKYFTNMNCKIWPQLNSSSNWDISCEIYTCYFMVITLQDVLSSITTSFCPGESSCQKMCYHCMHVKKDSTPFTKIHSFNTFIWKPPAAMHLTQPWNCLLLWELRADLFQWKSKTNTVICSLFL